MIQEMTLDELALLDVRIQLWVFGAGFKDTLKRKYPEIHNNTLSRMSDGFDQVNSGQALCVVHDHDDNKITYLITT